MSAYRTTAYRTTVDMDLPQPTVATGPCRARELTLKVIPLAFRSPRLGECPEYASRRIQVGLDVTADVCLWHSLTACEQLGARLVRSP